MSQTPSFQIETTTDPDVLSEAFRLRVSVWTDTGGLAPDAFPSGQWTDHLDDVAQHWVARDANGRVVAAARLTIHARLEEVDDAAHYLARGIAVDGPIAAPARVVVCPSTRGCGLASQLLDLQDQAARAKGAQWAIREASPAMVRLLKRRGWTILGPAPIDARFPGIEFQFAVRALNSDHRANSEWAA